MSRFIALHTLIIVLTSFFCHTIEADGDKLVTFQSDWPVGDPKRCLDYSRSVKQNVQTFEVLPGRGWDNLRNVEAGLVTNYNFTHCSMTDDGNYILPDNIMTIPIKNSQVQTSAELIKQWSESKSVTSDSVNADVGLSFPCVKISGKFSYEHEQMKSTQMEHDAMTTRVQLRYHRYEVKVRTDPELSPEFKGRLLVIGAELAMNQTDHARYLSQLLIRDFGTHVLTSLTAGAGLVKDDYFERNFYETSQSDTSSILVSASVSFFGIFHVDTSYSHHSSTQNTEGYDNSVRQSYIYTLGGPKFKTSMKVDDWADLVDSNLVAMDKSGDPLHFFINQHTLPELPVNIVEEIEQLVEESIEMYYEFNTIRGCTKLGQPNFSYAANFEDGTCKDVPTPVKFGGVYQTCYYTENNEPCYDIQQVNPKTGTFSCPQSYKPVLVFKTTLKQTSCFRCLSSQWCCENIPYQDISSYWCSPEGPLTPDTGYLFGGIYGNNLPNVLTGAESCPVGFYPRNFFYDMSVCISDDFEKVSGSSVPFGGFFSCQAGNPLAMDTFQKPTGNWTISAGSTLNSYLAQSGQEVYPRKCPDGFSQQLLNSIDGCSLHYCVRTGSMKIPNITATRRPPFMKKPTTVTIDKENIPIYNIESKAWVKVSQARKNNLSPKTSTEMPNTTIAGITTGVVIGCCGLIAMLVIIVKKNKSRRSGLYRKLTEETSESRMNYGTDSSA